MRISFLRLAASACVLAACSSKSASPDGGSPDGGNTKLPGADAPVDVQPLDCGSNYLAHGSFTWNDSSAPQPLMGGEGAATLGSEGGITRLDLTGSARQGTVSGYSWVVNATLTGKDTLLSGTYVCGQDAIARYEVSYLATCWSSAPTADCPARVAACTFTLDDQIWPGCFDGVAKGTFSLTLTGSDAGTVMITNGTFNVPIIEPVPPR